MSWIFCNPNPSYNLVGDCVVRALSLALHKDWEDIFIGISMKAYTMHDMPSSNGVWGAYLKDKGFKRYIIPNECPDCYTIKDFCMDHPYGIYILSTGTHVVTVIDGNYYDTWDSGKEIPVYYFEKEI